MFLAFWFFSLLLGKTFKFQCLHIVPLTLGKKCEPFQELPRDGKRDGKTIPPQKWHRVESLGEEKKRKSTHKMLKLARIFCKKPDH